MFALSISLYTRRPAHTKRYSEHQVCAPHISGAQNIQGAEAMQQCHRFGRGFGLMLKESKFFVYMQRNEIHYRHWIKRVFGKSYIVG